MVRVRFETFDVLEMESLADVDLERLKIEMDDAEDTFWSRTRLDHAGRRTNVPRVRPPSNAWTGTFS